MSTLDKIVPINYHPEFFPPFYNPFQTWDPQKTYSLNDLDYVSGLPLPSERWRIKTYELKELK